MNNLGIGQKESTGAHRMKERRKKLNQVGMIAESNV
jgi:hypothetical protein